MKILQAIAFCGVAMVLAGCSNFSRHDYKPHPDTSYADVLDRPIAVQYKRHYPTNEVDVLGSIRAHDNVYGYPYYDESYALNVFCADGRTLGADVVNITNQTYLNYFAPYHASAEFLRFKDRAMARGVASDPQYAPDVVEVRTEVESEKMPYPSIYGGLIRGYPALSAFERSPLGQLEETALDGDPNAQLSIGLDYESGHGVPQSDESAMEWFQLAADRGNPIAQNKLAGCYFYGIGTNLDYVQAQALYEQAAEQGYPPAQYSLGCMYEYGLGVPMDKIEAVTWYRRAAQQGYPDAMMNLGICYRDGTGVARDPLIAYMWMDCASRLVKQSQKEQSLSQISGNLDILKQNLTPEQIKQSNLLANNWYDDFRKAHQ